MYLKLSKMIDAYLSKRKESDGGYAPVTDKEIKQLYGIIQELLEKKYEKDPDGDLPVNYKLVNRTKYEPMHYFNLEYSHKVELLEDFLDIVDKAHANVEIATNRFSMLMKELRARQAEIRNKK